MRRSAAAIDRHRPYRRPTAGDSPHTIDLCGKREHEIGGEIFSAFANRQYVLARQGTEGVSLWWYFERGSNIRI